MAVNGFALGSVAVGSVLIYSGLKGKSVLASVQAVVQGKSPSILANVNPIKGTGNPNAVPTGTGQISGSVNGMAIASDALQYNGHKYVWGGPSNPANGWDCSSFVGYVLGHDFSITLPGNVAWNPNAHGPVASAYRSMGESIARSAVSAGDLIVWSTHIGIALNNSSMISALNQSLGTAVTGIENGGPQNESVSYRRLVMG
jgi:cell wall-associated NlpC family hydrolase